MDLTQRLPSGTIGTQRRSKDCEHARCSLTTPLAINKPGTIRLSPDGITQFPKAKTHAASAGRGADLLQPSLPAPGQTLTTDGNLVGGAIWGRGMGAALPPEDDPVEPPDAGSMDATNDAAPPPDDIQNDDAAQSDDTTNGQDSAVADAPPTQNDDNPDNPDDPNLQGEQTPRTLTKGCACQQPGNAPSPVPLWPALLLFAVMALRLTKHRHPNQT